MPRSFKNSFVKKSIVAITAVLPFATIGCNPQPVDPVSQKEPAVRPEPAPEVKSQVDQLRAAGASIALLENGQPDLVDLYNVAEAPELMDIVATLHETRALVLSGTNCGDDDLAKLSALANLTDLSLNGTSITDAGLKHLAHFPKLERLNLNETDVSDDGLAVIRQLPELQRIMLHRTRVSDAGLHHINDHKALEVVWLTGSLVTQIGADQLKQERSEMSITFEMLDANVSEEEIY
jgi:hypothetical protein